MKLGRNDKCWCGSGKKFKRCHLGVAAQEAPPTFETGARKILSDWAEATPIVGALGAVLSYIERKDWLGACHASTAVGFVLLREQGIEALPCVGEVRRGRIPFDHSWLEIRKEVFDVAIARPLVREMGLAPVVRGRHVDHGRPSDVQYGIVSGQPLMAPTRFLRSRSLAQYMDAFPNHTDGLFGLAVDLARQARITVASLAELRHSYAGVRWTLKPPADD